MKPYITYSLGRLVDIRPGDIGSVVESESYPELVHVWLESSNSSFPNVAAIDTEFESIEDILQPMRDNWEIDWDEPTQRHQSFLRMKNNPSDDWGKPSRDWPKARKLAWLLKRAGASRESAAERIAGTYPDLSDGEVSSIVRSQWGPPVKSNLGVRRGPSVLDPRPGMTVTDGLLSRATGGLRVGVVTGTDRPNPGDVRVRWQGEPAGIVQRRDLFRVGYGMAANAYGSRRWDVERQGSPAWRIPPVASF
jgi:hypothetical protein